MVEEVGELELGDGLPKGKLQEPFYGVRVSESVRIPKMGGLAALIESSGPGLVQRGGSPDRGVKSLREGLANLACKLHHLVVHIRAWLSSRSYGHAMAQCDMVLLCQP